MSELLDFILDHESAFKSKARLTSLYSDFSKLKATNPDGYAANTLAWRSALTNSSRAGVISGDNLLSFHSGEKLSKQLELKSLGRPLSLSVVLHDAVEAKQIIPLQEFLTSKTNIYTKSWIPPIPSAWDVAKWGFRQIGIMGSGNSVLVEGDFVVVANVEEATSKLLAAIHDNPGTSTSLIYSPATFTHAFASVLSPNFSRPLSQVDMVVLLQHLVRDKHLAATSMSSKDSKPTIKLASSPTAAPPTITAHDQTIATLQTLSLTLTTSIVALEARISSLTTSLNAALASSNRPLALTYLRARKAASATLLTREASLHQTCGVLDSIDDAATNVEMVKAMEAGAGVLADLNAEIGGAEGVQKVMDAVREGVTEAEEISGAIGELGAEEIDEDEVEAEMAALERREVEKGEEKERVEQAERDKVFGDMLPSVPTEEITATESAIAEKVLNKKLSDMSLDMEERASSDTVRQKENVGMQIA